MTPLQIAYKYMETFYGKEPLEELRQLMSDTPDFEGPFYHFISGDVYFRSLQANPPAGSGYQVLNAYANRNSACLIYRFKQSGVDSLMAQTFEVNGDKITKIRLIFDASEFT